jgi:hypothetical protein
MIAFSVMPFSFSTGGGVCGLTTTRTPPTTNERNGITMGHEQYVLTEDGQQWAQQNAGAMRREITAAVDKMTPDQLWRLWSQLGNEQGKPDNGKQGGKHHG